MITMTQQEIRDAFDKHGEDPMDFDALPNKRSEREDMHAFMLLDSLLPDKRNILSHASHDEVHLVVMVEDLVQSVITEQDIIELVACGIHISKYDGLCKFV